MTIKLKLQILMFVTLVAIAGGIVVTALGFRSVDEAQAAAHRRETQVRGLTEIKASALSTVELDAASDDTKHIFSDAEQNIAKWSDVIAPLFASPEQQERLRTLRAQWAGYDDKSRQLMTLAANDPKTAEEKVVDLYHSDFEPMRASIESIIGEASRRGQVAADTAERTSRNAVLTVVVVLGVVLVVVVGWIFVLSRSIQRSVAGIERTLEAASAALDLTKRAPVFGNDEISRTALAFNQLMGRIAEVMVSVRDSAESVSTASKQIAAGNVDLSARTEEQAASLEQTAASMEELTSTVRQNADNARQATGLASNASEIAGRGNDVVSNVVGTMDEIHASSSKIADIIGMIEGIAFQTNILALNAAVEAARAGEQGRGFAVVAGEVRSLAQRSSTAAKEIKELIDTSVGQVNAGSEQVGRAGTTMQEIIGAVSRVTDIMGEIAAASDEQSRGIDQVGQAVSQMDEVTQQNAALVEQAAAAAQSLEDQAKKLHAAVNTFRL
ncbi:methyl-accepting chemotaxis protein [Paraburkholderia caballeronis]|uniref:methyl-accepting chemotaxis protein n=1 Tax=Paraburkholderia caballeronis TaxID=416943 RepID=UPI0010659380|nr:methyl-accepting chemotaxis protein [Paraburkholderia caballeronis]TDV07183.1 methyl-accepting chemotaxis protein [Paraburkholderia caballeronis]TDV11327.1 methyl-accepting chemotaxis protein [Paraburkholderia caballeronis]TDV22512.1 methyl-accepting chemotaxis protein [Paraburkholderia caballeronis]TDV25615.1 methyl-accepting chemotaxis protein [Paraburkholderia caballeronis]